jgi:hypothetical protein
MALSATMGPGVLEQVRDVLNIDVDNSIHVNLGNNRPNITPLVVRMSRDSGFEDLRFLLDGLKPDGSGRLPRALVFFETREQAQKASDWLKTQLADQFAEFRNQIAYIHAGRTSAGRKHVMEMFRQGLLSILCATECVGMGADIPDIDLVVLFKVPANVMTLVQRIGRAGRGRQHARAILFVEYSVFEVVKPRKRKGKAKAGASNLQQDELDRQDMEANGEAHYRKKIDSGIRKFIELTTCRRVMLNDFFNNPPLPFHVGTNPTCCDVCLSSTMPEGARSFAHLWSRLDALAPLPSCPVLALPEQLSNFCPPKKVKKKNRFAARSLRANDHANKCRVHLDQWREETFNTNHSCASYGPEGVLSDAHLELLSNDPSISSLEKMRAHPALVDWRFLDVYGPKLVAILAQLDDAEAEQQIQLACLKIEDDLDDEPALLQPPIAPTRKRGAPDTAPAASMSKRSRPRDDPFDMLLQGMSSASATPSTLRPPAPRPPAPRPPAPRPPVPAAWPPPAQPHHPRLPAPEVRRTHVPALPQTPFHPPLPPPLWDARYPPPSTPGGAQQMHIQNAERAWAHLGLPLPPPSRGPLHPTHAPMPPPPLFFDPRITPAPPGLSGPTQRHHTTPVHGTCHPSEQPAHARYSTTPTLPQHRPRQPSEWLYATQIAPPLFEHARAPSVCRFQLMLSHLRSTFAGQRWTRTAVFRRLRLYRVQTGMHGRCSLKLVRARHEIPTHIDIRVHFTCSTYTTTSQTHAEREVPSRATAR